MYAVLNGSPCQQVSPWRVVLANARDGRAAQTLLSGRTGPNCAWTQTEPWDISADGRLAVLQTRAATTSPYLLYEIATGRTLRRLSSPAWIAPDSSRFAVATNGVLMVGPVRGGPLRRLAKIAKDTWQISWSPAGDALAYNVGGQILVTRVASGTSRVAVNDGWSPLWGRQGIAYSCNGRYAEHEAICMVRPDGSNAHVLFEPPQPFAPAPIAGAQPLGWSRDGRTLLMLSNFSPGCRDYVVRVPSGKGTEIDQHGSELLRAADISADGSEVLATTGDCRGGESGDGTRSSDVVSISWRTAERKVLAHGANRPVWNR